MIHVYKLQYVCMYHVHMSCMYVYTTLCMYGKIMHHTLHDIYIILSKLLHIQQYHTYIIHMCTEGTLVRKRGNLNHTEHVVV